MMNFKEFTEKMNAGTKVKGTYAALRFDDQSKAHIDQYIKDHGIPNPVPVDKLHSTLLYSRRHCEGYAGDPNANYKAMVGPMEVWPSAQYGNVLVAKLVCPELEDRHKHLMKQYNATYDHAEYKPHFTMSYDIGDFDHTSMKPFVHQLTMVDEYHKDLDLDWKPE